jgi:sugar phosphate isomerase/epimerase
MDKGKLIVFTKHFKGLGIERLIETIKSVGAEGADLCVRPGYPVEPGNAEKRLPETVRKFRDAGLNIPMITTPGDFLDPSQQITEKVISACGDAKIGLVKLGYWMMGKNGYWRTVDEIRQVLSRFVRLAEKNNVKVMIHNHSGSTMGLNSCAVMNLVKGFDPEYVGVFADVGHLSLVGEPLPMALDIVKEYLSAVAIKDLVRERVIVESVRKWQLRVVPLGEGFVDWHTLRDILSKIKFNGPFSIHSEYENLGLEDLIDQTGMDIRFFRRIISGTKTS